MGVIPTEWSQAEKMSAIRMLKEEDCLYALLSEAYLPLYSSSAMQVFDNYLAHYLLADPKKRMQAIEDFVERAKTVMPELLEAIISTADDRTSNLTLTELSQTFEQLQINLAATEISSETEEEIDPLDLYTVFSSASEISLIPNIVRG